MQVKINTQDLKSLISGALGIIPKNPMHTAIGTVKLEANGSDLKATAFDLSVGLTLNAEAEIEEAGAACIDPTTLASVVKKLPKEEGLIHLSLESQEDDGDFLKIETLEGTFKFPYQPGILENFPSIPEPEEADIVNVSAPSLVKKLKQVLPFASLEETKRHLTGVNIRFEGDGTLILASTDGHRLSRWEVNASLEEALIHNDFTLPPKTIKTIVKILEKEENEVELAFGEKGMILDTGNTTLFSRYLEGEYPNYEKLIPTQFDHKIEIGRDELAEVLERASAFDSKVQISALAESLTICAEGQNSGKSMEKVTVGEGNLFSFTIAFNTKYLCEGVKSLPSETVVFNCTDANSPIILTEPSGREEGLYLCMPIQIKA